MISLKRQVAEGVFLFSSGSLIVTFLHFLSSVVLIRSLGLFEYGLLVLALSFYAILVSFLSMGIGGVVLSDVSNAVGEKDYPKAKTLLKSYMKFELVMGIILLAVTVVISFPLKGIYNEMISNLLLIIALYLFTSGLQAAVSNVFYSLSRFRIYNALIVIEALSRFSLVLVFIAMLGEGILVAMIIYVAAQIISILVTLPSLLSIRNQLRKYPSSKEPLFRNMIKSHGKWVIFSLPIKRIGGQVHYWITEYFLGVNAVAILGVAMRGTDILKVFLQSFESVLMPITAGIVKSWERTKYLISKSIKYNLWGSVILAVPAIIFAQLLIELVFSGKYLDATPIFTVLLLTMIPFSLVVVLTPLFYALKIQKHLFYADFVVDILIIVLDVTFILFFGLVGIGISMILTIFMSFVIKYKLIKKSMPDFEIKMRNFFIIDDFDKRQFRMLLNKIKTKLHL